MRNKFSHGAFVKLRTKYFILLLAASLLPMIAVTIISQKASKKLGKSISHQVQQEIIQTIRKEITSATENYAMITRGSKLSIEFALMALKGNIETVLHKSTVPAPEHIYFASEFEDPLKAPADTAASSVHMAFSDNGKQTPKKVSYEYPNFLLAPGTDFERVKPDIDRFALLAPVLKSISADLGDHLFWIYASLENGVHISYPGHGGYPDGYDPRRRPWYTLAKKHGGLSWGEPILDVTTHQLTFTVSVPFHDQDGSFAGVAAIDVLVPNVLLKNQISSQWSDTIDSYLIGLSDVNDKGKQQLWILSHKGLLAQSKNPSGSSNKGMFNIENYPDFRQLIPHFSNQKSGNLTMPYLGKDALWAFAEIFPDLHFVVIAPIDLVTGLSKDVGDSFYGYSIAQSIISFAVILMVLVIVAILTFIISRVNTKNVMAIVNGFKRLEKGDYSVRLNLKFSDERDLIVTTFNQIIPKLNEHLRMSNALGLAKDVQQSLLPKENPDFDGFDIAGSSIYCEETGGDYYDFIDLEDDRLAVVVGDVSGHGVSSSLLMATARALIMLRASMPGPAASIINDVNRHLSHDTYDTGNFMTFFYCELSALNHEIRWVRAGHEPALLYDPERDEFDELKGRGLAFGVDYAFEYEEFQRSLKPGQIILVGTDGIWEMRNEQDEMFGKDRLMDIIRDASLASSKEIQVSISKALEDFRGSITLEDDVTMVVIKVE